MIKMMLCDFFLAWESCWKCCSKEDGIIRKEPFYLQMRGCSYLFYSCCVLDVENIYFRCTRFYLFIGEWYPCNHRRCSELHLECRQQACKRNFEYKSFLSIHSPMCKKCVRWNSGILCVGESSSLRSLFKSN